MVISLKMLKLSIIRIYCKFAHLKLLIYLWGDIELMPSLCLIDMAIYFMTMAMHNLWQLGVAKNNLMNVTACNWNSLNNLNRLEIKPKVINHLELVLLYI